MRIFIIGYTKAHASRPQRVRLLPVARQGTEYQTEARMGNTFGNVRQALAGVLGAGVARERIPAYFSGPCCSARSPCVDHRSRNSRCPSLCVMEIPHHFRRTSK